MLGLSSLAWKAIGAAVLLSAAVSLFFWIKSLRSDLEVAKFNYEIEKAAHELTEQTLETLRAQILINRQIEATRNEEQARDRSLQLEIKGTTSRADAAKNVPPPVLLDVLDKLRDSQSGSGADADAPGRSPGQRDGLPAGASNPAPSRPRERRSAREPDYRRHHARRPRLPKRSQRLREVVA